MVQEWLGLTLTVIWDKILQNMDKTSKMVQKEELNLLGATKELVTLPLFLSEKRSLLITRQLANVPEPSYEKIRKGFFFS